MVTQPLVKSLETKQSIDPKVVEKVQNILVDFQTGTSLTKIAKINHLERRTSSQMISKYAKQYITKRHEELKTYFTGRAWELANLVIDTLIDKLKNDSDYLTPKNAAILLGTILERLEKVEQSNFKMKVTKELSLNNVPDEILDQMINMAKQAMPKKEEETREVIDIDKQEGSDK